MEIIIVETPVEVAKLSAERIADVIRQGGAGGGAAVIGTATGSSPLGTYRELAASVRGDGGGAGDGGGGGAEGDAGLNGSHEAGLDVTGVQAFALDEYVGLDPEHPQSYHTVTRETVTEPLGLDPANVHVPDGTAADLEAGCAAYEAAITAAGGIDIQLLGIGANGHVGFNEPTSSLASRTRLKTLAPETRADNARFFDSPEQVPVHCVTQGIGTILDAKRVLLVAQGEGKAEAIAEMIEGPVSSMCPASALQMHPRATVIIDRAAASKLRLIDYYEYTQRQAPSRGPLKAPGQVPGQAPSQAPGQ